MTEVLIAGAGATGLAAAVGLAGQGRTVRLLESRPAAAGSAGRLFTLNWPARRLLARILPATPPAQPVLHMRIFPPDGRLLRFDAGSAGIACLAATVLEDDLLAALATARAAASIALQVDSQVTAAHPASDCWQVECGRSRTIATRLLIAADGAASPAIAAAGLARTAAGAIQRIESGWLEAPAAPAAVAWQWFAPFGILALLPSPDGRINFILSRPIGSDEGDDEDAGSLIDRVCRPEIGSWRMDARPRQFAAAPGRLRGWRPRLAAIGDCARSIYPLSGQGLAMGLGDVETLLDCLAGSKDPGQPAALQRYRHLRAIRTTATVRISGFFARAGSAGSPAARLLSLAARIDSGRAAALCAHLANAR